jgi:hypothetical protein
VNGNEINEEGTVIPEARLERVASGRAPVTPGWFVVNTEEAAWVTNDERAGVCIFESDDFVLRGRPDLTEYVNRTLASRFGWCIQGSRVYHAESVQEDFLILATGNRRDDLERVCPRSEVALRYDAGSEVTTADPERRGRWEVKRPEHWDELPWAEQP